MGDVRQSGTVRFVDERLARRLKPWAESTRDEKTAFILALQALDYAAEAIGRELQTTRNAVLGHIHRHRDCFPDTSSARRWPKKAAAPTAKPPVQRRPSVRVPKSPPHAAAAKTLNSSFPRSTEADRQPPSDLEAPGRAARSAPLEPSVVAPAPGPMSPSIVAEGGGIPFSDLADGLCRFPLWAHSARPTVPEMRFCGQGVHREGSSWCGAHARTVRGPS